MIESLDKKAFKAGLGYTIGNILIKGISFISVPVFARILTIGDYGIVNTFTAYVSIISIIIYCNLIIKHIYNIVTIYCTYLLFHIFILSIK